MVLPQPEGPSITRNSPSATVKVESCDGDEVAEGLAQMLDADFGHGGYSGNLETTMNIAVPARMVTKDQV